VIVSTSCCATTHRARVNDLRYTRSEKQDRRYKVNGEVLDDRRVIGRSLVCHQGRFHAHFHNPSAGSRCPWTYAQIYTSEIILPSLVAKITIERVATCESCP
jgi:hypothetical protein